MRNNQWKWAPAILAWLFCIQCTTEPAQTPKQATRKDTAAKRKSEDKPAGDKQAITYHILPMKDSGMAQYKRFTPEQKTVVYALNRKDAANIRSKDTLIVPDTFFADIMAYSPFPAEVPFLKDVNKLIYFSYPIQAFAAYENGRLIRWGPTSMGKKTTPTPTGLFFANWKAVETHSTVKDEWVLKWNFNIMNKFGVGWHQYAMPGYPASHSCLRLLEADARYLYDWADQWKLQGNNKILANGTPTIVYGAYPFGSPRPWRALVADPKANTVTVAALQEQTQDFLPKIMAAQEQRATLLAGSNDTATAAEKLK